MAAKSLVPLSQIYPEVKPDEFEKHTFTVQSRSEAVKPYRVYLDAYSWNGMCNCADFEFRFRPHLERGENPGDDKRCWHIKRARSYYLDEIGRQMDEQLQTQKNERF